MRRRSRSGSNSSANGLQPGGEVGLVEEPAAQSLSAGRFMWLGLSRKIFLTFLGLGVIGSIVGGGLHGTLSSLSATTTNTGNAFTAGTINMTNSAGCTDVIASSCGTLNLVLNTGMQPGDVASGTVTISNTGTLPASFTVSAANVSATNSLNTHAALSIHDDTENKCIYGHSGLPYSGACDTLEGLNTASIAASNDIFQATSTLSVPGSGPSSHWNPAEAHTFTVTVEIATDATSTQAGSNVSIDFVWTSVQ